jgi:hypothetical protein
VSQEFLGWSFPQLFDFRRLWLFTGAEKADDGYSHQQKEDDSGDPMASFHIENRQLAIKRLRATESDVFVMASNRQ